MVPVTPSDPPHFTLDKWLCRCGIRDRLRPAILPRLMLLAVRRCDSDPNMPYCVTPQGDYAFPVDILQEVWKQYCAERDQFFLTDSVGDRLAELGLPRADFALYAGIGHTTIQPSRFGIQESNPATPKLTSKVLTALETLEGNPVPEWLRQFHDYPRPPMGRIAEVLERHRRAKAAGLDTTRPKTVKKITRETAGMTREDVAGIAREVMAASLSREAVADIVRQEMQQMFLDSTPAEFVSPLSAEDHASVAQVVRGVLASMGLDASTLAHLRRMRNRPMAVVPRGQMTG